MNGADFGSCIRCNSKLDRTLPADRATRRVPAPRKRFSAGPGSEPLLGRWAAETLPATWILVFLNVIVFAGQLLGAFQRAPGISTLLSGGGSFDLFQNGALLISREGVWILEPWRLLSACFVHFGPIHLMMNLFALHLFARAAEPSIGSVRFIIAYTITGIAGFAGSVLWFLLTGTPSFTAGASGAVFGVMGLVLGLLLRRRDPRWKEFFVRFVAYSLGMTLVISFMVPINHSAHLGGLAAGVALGALFAKNAPQPSRMWQRVLASVCVLAILGSLIAARMSPLLAAVANQS